MKPKIVVTEKLKLSKDDLADIMLNSDPWLTLGTTKKSLAHLEKTLRSFEVLAATHGKNIVGFAIIQPGFLLGKYLRLLAVRDEYRSKGVGTLLMDKFESRTFKEVPNAYLCVSSFNTRARRFYERRGYATV